MTTAPTVGSRSTWSRRTVVLVVMVIAAMLVGAFGAARLLWPPLPTVGWFLADGLVGGPSFDPSTAQTTTVVPIEVYLLDRCAHEDAMLTQPEVSYTPTSVTITMRLNLTASALSACPALINGKVPVGRVLDVGVPVQVYLISPLAGRALFDGADDPPDPRPYG